MSRGLLIISTFLSALSAVFMLVPYASVYFIVKELLVHAANPTLVDADLMLRW